MLDLNQLCCMNPHPIDKTFDFMGQIDIQIGRKGFDNMVPHAIKSANG